MAELDEDLKLPEQKLEEDSKVSIGEERVMDKKKKKLLAEQKKFEYSEIEGKKIRDQEEVKEQKKSKLFQWIIAILVIALLGALYIWLLV